MDHFNTTTEHGPTSTEQLERKETESEDAGQSCSQLTGADQAEADKSYIEWINKMPENEVGCLEDLGDGLALGELISGITGTCVRTNKRVTTGGLVSESLKERNLIACALAWDEFTARSGRGLFFVEDGPEFPVKAFLKLETVDNRRDAFAFLHFCKQNMSDELWDKILTGASTSFKLPAAPRTVTPSRSRSGTPSRSRSGTPSRRDPLSSTLPPSSSPRSLPPVPLGVSLRSMRGSMAFSSSLLTASLPPVPRCATPEGRRASLPLPPVPLSPCLQSREACRRASLPESDALSGFSLESPAAEKGVTTTNTAEAVEKANTANPWEEVKAIAKAAEKEAAEKVAKAAEKEAAETVAKAAEKEAAEKVAKAAEKESVGTQAVGEVASAAEKESKATAMEPPEMNAAKEEEATDKAAEEEAAVAAEEAAEEDAAVAAAAAEEAAPLCWQALLSPPEVASGNGTNAEEDSFALAQRQLFEPQTPARCPGKMVCVSWQKRGACPMMEQWGKYCAFDHPPAEEEAAVGAEASVEAAKEETAATVAEEATEETAAAVGEEEATEETAATVGEEEATEEQRQRTGSDSFGASSIAALLKEAAETMGPTAPGHPHAADEELIEYM